MDYEKKYKSVLQTATQWIKDGCTDKEKICLECVFPELKESEDERIRRIMIDHFKNQPEQYTFGGLTNAEVVDYLEKQKEAQPGDEDRYMEGYMNGMNDALKEQKPAEWSEEDKEKLSAVISLMKSSRAVDPFYDKMCLEGWLKSLRPQLKPDCSACAKHLDGYISGRADAEKELLEKYGMIITPDDEIRIKPQPHWKPSKEDLTALEYCAEHTCPELLSLYLELKKL